MLSCLLCSFDHQLVKCPFDESFKVLRLLSFNEAAQNEGNARQMLLSQSPA